MEVVISKEIQVCHILAKLPETDFIMRWKGWRTDGNIEINLCGNWGYVLERCILRSPM